MKIITLKIQNGYNTNKQVSILDTLFFTKDNFGLPKKINISVGNDFEKDADNYAKLLSYIMSCPFMCKIISSTNNRQLYFYDKEFYGNRYAMEPSLDINGNPREKRFFNTLDPNDGEPIPDWEYVKKWNPLKWNIADTHEPFLAKHPIVFDLLLKPHQKFELYIAAFEREEANLGKYNIHGTYGFNKQYTK